MQLYSTPSINIYQFWVHIELPLLFSKLSVYAIVHKALAFHPPNHVVLHDPPEWLLSVDAPDLANGFRASVDAPTSMNSN